MDLPPPPPGSDESLIPPPPGASDIPPPGDEVHENDVLKRRKHFSWRNFGGDGFLVSVAFHVLLLLVGLFYVIQKYVEPKKKPDTEIFATGAGGGASGDKAKQFETTMKRKMATPVKTPSRIVSKSATASVSLPSSPTTSTASFASGLASGGMSKGAGGGSGGGEGTGIGIGKGGGRNFVSLFGARGTGTPGLPGVFFDGKQTPKGKATEYAADATHWNFYSQVLVDIAHKWNQNDLERKFFKAPEGLVASQIFIPRCKADAAPAAYGVQDKVKPSRWIAWYRGTVTAPKSGKFRFWAEADDFVSIRWNRKTVVAAKWATGHDDKFKELQKNPTVQKGAAIYHASPWITVQKGSQYPLEIIVSELPGGAFEAEVLMEEYDESKRDGDGKIFLFRMSDEGLPEDVKDGTGMNVDLTGKGLIWKATGDKNASGPVR